MIGSVLDWFDFPENDNGTALYWFGGLVVVLILSFLWVQIMSKIQ